MSSPQNPIDRSNIFAESKRIVKANTAHFLSLLFIFFLPLIFSLLTLLNFILSQSNSVSLNPLSVVLSYYKNSPYWIAFSILYALLALSLDVAGVATITYSTQQGLYNKPLNLSSTIKSLSKSFLPLASTTLTSVACLLSACIAFLLFFGSLVNSLQIPEFQINYSSQFCVITFAVMTEIFMISFHLHLILAAIISVIELKWGFEPLRRSFYLIGGMKWSSLLRLLLRGILTWVVLLRLFTQIFTPPGPWNYAVFLKIMGNSIFWMIFMSPLVNVYTVLYVNCKDLHEEAGIDIAVEISKECVNLAIDDNTLVSESSFLLLR